jgi:hypothetical protein
MKTNRPRAKTSVQPGPQQVTLALEAHSIIPELTRRQCLTLLAEMLKNLVRHERKENANER